MRKATTLFLKAMVIFCNYLKSLIHETANILISVKGSLESKPYAKHHFKSSASQKSTQIIVRAQSIQSSLKTKIKKGLLYFSFRFECFFSFATSAPSAKLSKKEELSYAFYASGSRIFMKNVRPFPYT